MHLFSGFNLSSKCFCFFKIYNTTLVVELSSFIALHLFFTCTFPGIVQSLVYSGIGTGKEAPHEMVKNVKSLKQIGENAMNEFIAKFTFQENNTSQNTYYDSIKKPKVVSFVTTSTKKISKIAEDENKSFGKIFACFDNQTLNLRQIINWSVTNKSYSTCSEDGKVKTNTKSLFRNKLQSLCPVAPTNFAKVLLMR